MFVICSQIVSSMFIPKVIVTFLVFLMVYTLTSATNHFVNRETFSYLGYYNSIVSIVQHSIINMYLYNSLYNS